MFLADHCIQLIGAADVVRAVLPDIPVFFGMLISSMSDTWAPGKIAGMMGEFRDEFVSFTGHPVSDEALASSIRAHNRDRRLIRRLFDKRSSGSSAFTPRQLQDIVGSSMVMDPAEHHALLAEAVAAQREAPRDDRVRVHLSAHLCHAPKRELLDLIEDSGAIVVDDDLFHGRRYVSTDVDETGDPIDAIARWYARRNVNIPCPTRVQQRRRLGRLPGRRGASERGGGGHPPAGQILRAAHALLPRAPQGPGRGRHPPAAARDRARGPPAESFRTRVEALVERARRKRPVPAWTSLRGRNRPMDATQDRSNRLSVTRAGGQLITDYWDGLFTAREQGKQIVWYNGGALNPFFQAAGLAWCHGEAFAARLAAQRLEGPASWPAPSTDTTPSCAPTPGRTWAARC